MQIRNLADDMALLPFAFGANVSKNPLQLPCTRLAGAEFESWIDGEIVESAETEGACFAHTMDFAMTALTVEERDGDIAAATQEAYERLLAAVRPSSHPYLIRIWNYFDRINEGEGDQERYRQFCVGRAKAVDGMFNDPPPAATAIGGDGIKGRIKIVALCAAKPAIALENPRQTPAWQYPKDFGPVAPGFSRGAIINHDLAIARLLASGTASITGHESQHTGDSKAQITEALSNLRALLEVGTQRSGRQFTLAGCDILRVYLRNPKDLAFAQEALAATDVPASHVIFLRGDICRRELDVEIEGVFAAR